MMKKLTALALGGTLLCTIAISAVAAGNTAAPAPTPMAVEECASMSNSVLYYGKVMEIVKNKDGAITQLHMTSDRTGEYVMNLSSETVWIDSANHTAADSSHIQKGERIYVFHSAVETSSLPPQSAAFAIVRNVPVDAGCAQYHEVEAVSRVNGRLTITTDCGGLLISADDQTKLTRYGDGTRMTIKDIQVGDRIMAWYDAIAESYPGQTYAQYLMLLPGKGVGSEKQEQVLTRADLVSMLHEKVGKPVVNDAMDYTDVASDAGYAEAVRWATSQKLVGGYGDGRFEPEKTVSREQMVTILWRYAGCPMLMDDTGLTQFSDGAKISDFARPAMAWAHQKGLISTVEHGVLAPRGAVTQAAAETALNAVDIQK